MAVHCIECGEQVGDLEVCPRCGAPNPDAGSRKAGQGKPSESDSGSGPPADPTPGTVIRSGKEKEGTPSTVMLSSSGESNQASFGRYRVLREVGRGAMGVVYLARDDKIGRNVAIKALDIDRRLPEDEKEEIRNRFEREARAAGMLSHQNIVTVYDVG